MRIISCNLLNPQDQRSTGENTWENRRHLLFETVLRRDPQIICCQECTWDQRNDFLAELGPDRFGAFGVEVSSYYRYPLNTIFYDKRSFQLINAGAYWLSETPHLFGSKSKDGVPRVANYVVLRGSAGDFRVLNTHLTPYSNPPEVRAAEVSVILEESTVWGGMPQIITGDMNARRDYPELQRFFEAGWQDSFSAATGVEEPGITHHNFEGETFQGKVGGKIDWILINKGFQAVGAEVIRDRQGNRYPSDHFFITADLIFHYDAP